MQARCSMTWTRAHERMVDAWVDLYRIGASQRRPPRSLESWIGAKFKIEYPVIADLTVAQCRQARRCLRAWRHWDGVAMHRRGVRA